MSAEAPPLGHRPTEPTPGSPSLEDPQGKRAAGDGGKDVCPDCGLPFGEHPDTHLHGGDGERWAEDLDGDEADVGVPALQAAEGEGAVGDDDNASQLSSSHSAPELPGQQLDEDELGGDPAEA